MRRWTFEISFRYKASARAVARRLKQEGFTYIIKRTSKERRKLGYETWSVYKGRRRLER